MAPRKSSQANAGDPADTTPRADADAAEGPLKMRDLVATVARRTGARPAAVKAAVEATVTALGAALQTGRGLNLPGLGKARVARGGGDKPLTIKLKPAPVPTPPKEAQEALADDDQ